MGLRWSSILGFHAVCKTLFDMPSISKDKNRQGCFRTHFQRVGPNPLLVLFALTAVHNSKMFFLGAINIDKQFKLMKLIQFHGLLTNCGTRLCGIRSKRPLQQWNMRGWAKSCIQNRYAPMSSGLTIDFTLLIEAWSWQRGSGCVHLFSNGLAWM